jgi:hypothetical protein
LLGSRPKTELSWSLYSLALEDNPAEIVVDLFSSIHIMNGIPHLRLPI